MELDFSNLSDEHLNDSIAEIDKKIEETQRFLTYLKGEKMSRWSELCRRDLKRHKQELKTKC
jgi:hypothetical protein